MTGGKDITRTIIKKIKRILTEILIFCFNIIYGLLLEYKIRAT